VGNGLTTPAISESAGWQHQHEKSRDEQHHGPAEQGDVWRAEANHGKVQADDGKRKGQEGRPRKHCINLRSTPGIAGQLGGLTAKNSCE
jgi:hypothetical protein